MIIGVKAGNKSSFFANYFNKIICLGDWREDKKLKKYNNNFKYNLNFYFYEGFGIIRR